MGDDLTEEDIGDMIADVDTDGSGWVDYDGTYSVKCACAKGQSAWCHGQMIGKFG